jgi:hypothetical protein
MTTAPDIASLSPAPPVAKPVAKKRPAPIERFPLRFHCAITVAMNDSIKRMTGNNSLLSESDVGRMALHGYLLANDPGYVRVMRGGNNA